MPKLKDDLLREFYDRSLITEQEFAERSGVSRSTLQNAANGLNLRSNVVRDIARGMGLSERESHLLCQGNPHTVPELISMALQRLGMGLWGVCHHTPIAVESLFVRKFLLRHWEGEIVQPLPGVDGVMSELRIPLDGHLWVAGRSICGEFSQVVQLPDATIPIQMRVEGHWFNDRHFVALYRYMPPAPPNYGTIHMTMSPLGDELTGDFTGWANTIGTWITGKIRLKPRK